MCVYIHTHRHIIIYIYYTYVGTYAVPNTSHQMSLSVTFCEGETYTYLTDILCIYIGPAEVSQQLRPEDMHTHKYVHTHMHKHAHASVGIEGDEGG